MISQYFFSNFFHIRHKIPSSEPHFSTPQDLLPPFLPAFHSNLLGGRGEIDDESLVRRVSSSISSDLPKTVQIRGALFFCTAGHVGAALPAKPLPSVGSRQLGPDFLVCTAFSPANSGAARTKAPDCAQPGAFPTLFFYFPVALSTRNCPTFSWKKYSSKLLAFA